MTINEEIIDYVKEHPGTTSQQVIDALPSGTKKGTIQCTLSRLQRTGVIKNRGGTGNRFTPPAQWYICEPNATEYARELARDIYNEMLALPTRARENFLAEKLEELFETQPYK